jgi:hypothetical protein
VGSGDQAPRIFGLEPRLRRNKFKSKVRSVYWLIFTDLLILLRESICFGFQKLVNLLSRV